MGGGPINFAVKEHLKAGLKVYAAPLAAKTIYDDLEKVKAQGVKITSKFPQGAEILFLKDFNLKLLEEFLTQLEVKLPNKFAIACQDHGESLKISNRIFRFQFWEKFVNSGGNILNLIYGKIPSFFARMLAIRRDSPGALVMDTCSAAIWGALEDDYVKKVSKKGVVILNLGNHHLLGILLKKEKVFGVLEHHLHLLNKVKIKELINKFINGRLTFKEVYSQGGHGCIISPEYLNYKKFDKLAVIGPQREILKGEKVYFASPYGDMMLTGAFGLIAAYKRKFSQLQEQG
ncbi:MAG: DUF1786 domain-containing protein [Armatimonadetes bacterium]|nr:DUF1786 domain-containing protein [Armatimonadota bacterium]